MLARLASRFSGFRRNPDLLLELSQVVDQVKGLTNASGAAIALTTGNAGEIECRARSGMTAPEIGSSMLVEDSLTALCLRSGKQVRCDNTQSDPRMQSAAMFDLGVRSLVITPIVQEGRVRGVLAVFANATYGFSAAHLHRLNTIADQIAGILWEKPRPAKKSPVSLRLLTRSDLATSDVDSETGAEQAAHPPAAQAAERPVGTSLPTPVISRDGFATLDAVVGQREKWLTSNIVLIAAVALVILIGIIIWAVLASPGKAERSASTPAANIESKGHPDAVDNATIHPRSSETPSGSHALLKIEPSASVSRPGATFALNVVISRGRDISSVPMQIDYDPLLLRFVSLSQGEIFSKVGANAVLLHRDDASTGSLKINAQSPPGTTGFPGDGTVCQLVFAAVEKGSGAISIAATPHDSHGKPLNLLKSRAAVTVN